MNKRITMFISLILVLGGGIMLPSTSSWAADIFFYPQAGATRYLYLNPSSNGCVGKPASPECAVETWKSCLFYQRREHCDVIGLKGMKFIESSMPPDIHSEINKFISAYRFIYKVIIGKKDIPLNSTRSDWLRSGDVEIEYSYMNCYGQKRKNCKWDPIDRENIFLRRQPNGNWYVFAWRYFLGDKIWENSEDNKCDALCKLTLSDFLYADYVRNIDPDRKIGIRGSNEYDPIPLRLR